MHKLCMLHHVSTVVWPPFRYQKTKETLSGWGGKASSAMQKAGTAIKWDTLNSA